MTSTNFSNSSGINDPNNYSTVRDIALMSKYLIENYPTFYEWYKETNFFWIEQAETRLNKENRNPFLYKKVGVDGIKNSISLLKNIL